MALLCSTYLVQLIELWLLVVVVVVVVHSSIVYLSLIWFVCCRAVGFCLCSYTSINSRLQFDCVTHTQTHKHKHTYHITIQTTAQYLAKRTTRRTNNDRATVWCLPTRWILYGQKHRQIKKAVKQISSSTYIKWLSKHFGSIITHGHFRGLSMPKSSVCP